MAETASVTRSERAVGTGSRWLEPAAAALLVALLLLLAGLHWLNRSETVDTWWIGNLVLATALGGFGLLLVRRVPRNPIGWLMLVGGLANATMGAAREWMVYGALTDPGALPAPAWAGWLGSWPYLVSLATLPLVLVLFPDGRLLSRRWRVVPVTVVAATVVGCIATALVPMRFVDESPITSPLGVDSPLLDALVGLGQLLLLVAIVASIVSLVVRTRGSSGELRQQLKWIAFAGSLLGLEIVFELVLALGPIAPPALDPSDWLSPVLVVCFLAAVTMAVLRYRLWDIDALISRSLVYGTLTVVLGAAYVGIVTATGRLRDHPVAVGSSVAAAAVVAVSFAPLRDLLQRHLDRRLFGDRSEPYRAFARLGDRIGEDASGDSVLDEVVDAVAASLRLGSVAIVVPDDGTVASTGSSRSAAVELPLVFRATAVGTLVVSHRPGGVIGPREHAVLVSLLPPIAAVVHAVSVGRALQRSRQELVTLREQERRRVHRDLHDGLGPALAAVRMKVDGARLMIDRDPERAKQVLSELTDDISATIADVRRLVYDLQPPALEEIGLASAVAEQAAAFTGRMDDGRYLDVEVDAPQQLPPLPAAVEVAVYRIVCESLNNVVRHAHATRCRITLTCRPGADLSVLVDDDGTGCPPGARGGVGIRSMLERAAELEGTCVLERSPLGGTRVAAVLPLGLGSAGGSRARPEVVA